MKVLLVSHNYPPAHVAGTEQYSAQVARGLRARGYEVEVFTTEKDIARAHLSLREREHEGVRVHELVNNLEYESFRETWDYPALEVLFEQLLERVQPDLVHFQHLLYLSVGCVEAVQRRGLPVVFTLHDYWLQCARFGQRVQADGTVCETIDEQQCARCLGSFRYRNSALEQRAGRLIARLRKYSGVDLSGPARKAGDLLRSKPNDADPASLPLEEVTQRNRGLATRLEACVDRFLSPSAFLRAELVKWGIDPEHIEHLPTGTDLQQFAGGQREPRGARLRVGFIGSLIPVKGAHLLLEAVRQLDVADRARLDVCIFGPSFHDAAYHAQLIERAAELEVRLGGRLDRDGVAQALRSLDLLVVPSLWFENQPLVILEALAAQTPLAVSDLGGMAELVRPGVHGFRFPMGDAGALAELLGELGRDPARLDALYPKPVRLPSSGDQLDAIEAVYRQVSERP